MGVNFSKEKVVIIFISVDFFILKGFAFLKRVIFSAREIAQSVEYVS